MDISFKTDAGKLNYRITGAIFNKETKKFLFQKGNGFDFFVLPGGRCQMGELSSDALLREISEELGANGVINSKIVAISENLFNFDNTTYHELSFCYKLELDDVLNKEILNKPDEFYGPEGDSYFFKWMSVEEIEKERFESKFAIDILKRIEYGELSLKHYTLNEI